jgi:hypothetical protein
MDHRLADVKYRCGRGFVAFLVGRFRQDHTDALALLLVSLVDLTDRQQVGVV